VPDLSAGGERDICTGSVVVRLHVVYLFRMWIEILYEV
jgi:hypothetical protein